MKYNIKGKEDEIQYRSKVHEIHTKFPQFLTNKN